MFARTRTFLLLPRRTDAPPKAFALLVPVRQVKSLLHVEEQSNYLAYVWNTVQSTRLPRFTRSGQIASQRYAVLRFTRPFIITAAFAATRTFRRTARAPYFKSLMLRI